MDNCIVCNHQDLTTIYEGHLRTGSFGKHTNKKYNVYLCTHCKSKFIKDILPQDYYQTPEYRQDYNDTIDLQKFYQENDLNDTNKITQIGLNTFRNRVVADFGAAAGSFLQAINNISSYTIAIEPSKHFHDILNQYNKYVFSYGTELVKEGIKVDIATSFDVIEHVPSPINYLKEIYESLEKEGKLFLKTPNFNDILHELLPKEFDTFNYRTAHLFYFDETSLEYVLKEAGFVNYKIRYTHDYDISNLLFWMKDLKPTGLGKTDLFDNGFNQIYKNYLEKTSKASHLWVEAIK